LLHPLPLNNGSASEVRVLPLGPRNFRLTPWPFSEPEMRFVFPARHVRGKRFDSSAQLEAAFHEAQPEQMTVVLSA
jgi:hypothetical protein